MKQILIVLVITYVAQMIVDHNAFQRIMVCGFSSIITLHKVKMPWYHDFAKLRVLIFFFTIVTQLLLHYEYIYLPHAMHLMHHKLVASFANKHWVSVCNR